MSIFPINILPNTENPERPVLELPESMKEDFSSLPEEEKQRKIRYVLLSALGEITETLKNMDKVSIQYAS